MGRNLRSPPQALAEEGTGSHSGELWIHMQGSIRANYSKLFYWDESHEGGNWSMTHCVSLFRLHSECGRTTSTSLQVHEPQSLPSADPGMWCCSPHYWARTSWCLTTFLWFFLQQDLAENRRPQHFCGSYRERLALPEQRMLLTVCGYGMAYVSVV